MAPLLMQEHCDEDASNFSLGNDVTMAGDYPQQQHQQDKMETEDEDETRSDPMMMQDESDLSEDEDDESDEESDDDDDDDDDEFDDDERSMVSRQPERLLQYIRNVGPKSTTPGGVGCAAASSSASSSMQVVASSSYNFHDCCEELLIDDWNTNIFHEIMNWMQEESDQIESLGFYRSEDGDIRRRSPEEITYLLQTLSTLSNLRDLTLRWFDDRYDAIPISNFLMNHSKLRSVSISFDTLPSSLFQALTSMPRLQRLDVKSSEIANISDITHLLRDHETLESFEYTSFNAVTAIDQFCFSLAEALSVNKVLRRLKLTFILIGNQPSVEAKQALLTTMKNHNFTLQDFWVNGWGGTDGKDPIMNEIQYNVELNARGRGQIRNGGPGIISSSSSCSNSSNSNNTSTTDTPMGGGMVTDAPIAMTHQEWVDLLSVKCLNRINSKRWDLDWIYYIVRSNPTLCGC